MTGLVRNFVSQVNTIKAAVLATLAAVSGSALVGFLQAGTGAVLRTLQDLMRDRVSVRDFGAVGDGATDDTAAIQAAFTAAASGTIVEFPRSTGDYLLGNNVNVPAGVHIRGPGKVRRTHGLSVNNYAFTLAGGNTVHGLAYDGGALTIVSPGLMLSIKDFRCIGNDVEFSGNTLDNSCGSFWDFTNDQYATPDTLLGLILRGNRIGNYLDHAIYCQGYSTVETADIAITGNTFVGRLATTTRPAVKLKNIRAATLTGNAIDLPLAAFVTLDIGLDSPAVGSDISAVTITGNTGSCRTFIESVAALDAGNATFVLRGVQVAGNTVECSYYIASLGLVPDGATSYATRVNGVRFTGNTFKGAYGFNINGDKANVGAAGVSIDGNSITITTGNTVLNLWGNVDGLVCARNSLTMLTAFAAGNAIWNNANIVGASGVPSFAASVAGVYDFTDNDLFGNFGCLVAEQPGSAITALNMTCVLRGNKNFGTNAGKREIVLTSTALASATGLFYLSGNQSIGGSESSNICAVQALVSGVLRIGSGSAGLLIRPNTSNNGLALYSTSVTPDATNFALQSTGALSILNGTSSAILQVGNSTKLAVNASGVTVHGALGAGAAASTLASSGTIAPTAMVHFVSGTTAISTITPPGNIATTGGLLVLIPTGAFTLNTAGNIAAASTAVVGRPMLLAYDTSGGGKWYPSY